MKEAFHTRMIARGKVIGAPECRAIDLAFMDPIESWGSSGGFIVIT